MTQPIPERLAESLADPLYRATTLAKVFSEVTLDAAHLDIAPYAVRVSHSAGSPIEVEVHIADRDIASANRLGDYYKLDPPSRTFHASIHHRESLVTLAGNEVTLTVWCARPDAPAAGA